MRTHTPRAAFVALLFVLSACAQGTQPAGQPEAGSKGSFPVTIETAGGKVTIEERPERIVSISPTATEILFAVGAGEQVVAVDDQSDFPPEAPMTKLSGFEPNVEAIAKYEPDLVVASDTAGVARPLKQLDIPLLVQPAAVTLDDTFDQIRQMGEATGNPERAGDVARETRDEIAELVRSIRDFASGLTYYHELDDTYFSVTSETFIGHIYELVGLENIADEADKAGSGYPQLNSEYIVKADPDLIFLADTECCNQSAATVAKRPGWDQITAVQNTAVVELDDDIASRWGPRVVDFLQKVADATADLKK